MGATVSDAGIGISTEGVPQLEDPGGGVEGGEQHHAAAEVLALSTELSVWMNPPVPRLVVEYGREDRRAVEPGRHSRSMEPPDETKAAECLDISRKMLIYRMEKFNLRKDD